MVDLPIIIVMFHSFLYIYQRVLFIYCSLLIRLIHQVQSYSALPSWWLYDNLPASYPSWSPGSMPRTHRSFCRTSIPQMKNMPREAMVQLGPSTSCHFSRNLKMRSWKTCCELSAECFHPHEKILEKHWSIGIMMPSGLKHQVISRQFLLVDWWILLSNGITIRLSANQTWLARESASNSSRIFPAKNLHL